jgi:hypothetical protein
MVEAVARRHPKEPPIGVHVGGAREQAEARWERPTISDMMSRLTSAYAADAAAPGDSSAARPFGSSQLAYLSRCAVLQAIGGAFLVALWIAGIAGKPFETESAFLCWLILGIGALGIFCLFLQRWKDVEWLATHVVRIGLLGTVVGLIIAFSAAGGGGSSDPDEVRSMIAAVVDGMYVSLYATLLGIAVNLWLKINLRLLGGFHG